jgi:hypothetical protein
MDMPFGKHKGAPLEELPDDYLVWLNKAEDLYPPLRRAVDEEYARRFGPGGPPPPSKPSRSSGYIPPSAESRGLSAKEARLLVDVLRAGFCALEEGEAGADQELDALREKVKKLTWGVRS